MQKTFPIPFKQHSPKWWWIACGYSLLFIRPTFFVVVLLRNSSQTISQKCYLHITHCTLPQPFYHPVQLSRPPFTCIRCKAIVTSIRRAEWKENAIPARWHFNVKLNSRSVPTHATLSILSVSATLPPPTYTHTDSNRSPAGYAHTFIIIEKCRWERLIASRPPLG